jgi:hypothetical protein
MNGVEGNMEHAEARELLELAAVEPHGFERLMAGDTTDAAALAGHLAGCADCSEELARLRRAAGIIREVVRTTPPTDLRDRTLAFVREVGTRRGPAVATAVAATAVGASSPAQPSLHSIPGPADREAAHAGGRGGFGRPAWLGAIAAAIVVSVVATGLVVRAQVDDRLRGQEATVQQLARVTSWYVDIEAQPDAQRVSLSSPNGSATGTVEFSAATGKLVVVANGLSEPTGDQPLGCWIEIDGNRRAIGRMFFGGGISYWAGPVDQLSTVRTGAKFGVSMPGGDTILVGQL